MGITIAIVILGRIKSTCILLHGLGWVEVKLVGEGMVEVPLLKAYLLIFVIGVWFLMFLLLNWLRILLSVFLKDSLFFWLQHSHLLQILEFDDLFPALDLLIFLICFLNWRFWLFFITLFFFCQFISFQHVGCGNLRKISLNHPTLRLFLFFLGLLGNHNMGGIHILFRLTETLLGYFGGVLEVGDELLWCFLV